MTTTTNARQWAQRYPDLGTDPVPVESCIASEYFEREREGLFRHVWLNVGREGEAPGPGDYFVREIAATSSSVLIVRGKDGVLRGFHNICTHRCNKLTRNGNGHTNGFVCGFHGWAFDLTGKLIRVPDEAGFFEFDKTAYHLKPIATEIWEGFIFINLAAQPSQSLAEFLGDWSEELRGYPFGSMALREHYQAEVKVNWKIALDAFQETWHARFVHKRSGGEAYASKDNPYIHVLQFKLWPLHRMMSVPGNPQFVPTPMQIYAHQFGKSYISQEAAGTGLPPGVNPTRAPVWMFDAHHLFPNFSIFVFDGMFFTYHFWPLAVDRTLWETKTYYPVAEHAGQRFSQEYAKCALRDTWLEDLSTLENIQAAISSRAIRSFALQDQEILVRHSHKVIADYIKATSD